MAGEKLPELLAPVGEPAALRAALDGGANAVYLGTETFNARAYAGNFSVSELKDAVDAAHSRGVRVYVTLNTQIYDREIANFLKTAEDIRAVGADAAIVADSGCAALLRRYVPELPLHASTQMAAHNVDAVRMLAGEGFSRVVPARELSCADISRLVLDGSAEIEIFVHGALCVSHSGQCLFSSMVGGRSGNRGECAQPCRLPYGASGDKKRYPLSLKDMCLAEYVPDIIASGVHSLKIEGRMKPPEYVYAVTRVWRTLLDEGRAATEEEMRYLAAVFSRQGFTSSYFVGKTGSDMLGVRTEADKSRSNAVKRRIYPPLASKEPIVPTRLVALPNDGEDASEPYLPRGKRKKEKTAYFAEPRNATSRAREYFDKIYFPLERFSEGGVKPDGVAIPPVVFDSDMPAVRRMLASAYRAGIRHALVGNIGHIDTCREAGMEVHGDLRLNICNSASARQAEERGFCDFVLSPELTLPRIRDIGGDGRAIVWGRIPLMVTEKCVGKEIGGCDVCRRGKSVLIDRRGARFPVLRSFAHRSVIYNSLPTCMSDRRSALAAAGIRGMHFIFTIESPKTVDAVISAFEKGAACPVGECRRIPQK